MGDRVRRDEKGSQGREGSLACRHGDSLARSTSEPGAVPPFGRPILPLDLFVDPDLLEHERIAFTPGVHTVSIIVASDDYRRLAGPEVFSFRRPD